MKQHQSIKYMRQGLLGGLLVAAMCMAARVQAAEGDTKGQLSSTDYRFVSTVIVDNQTEVTLGRLAEQNGSDPSVKEFGTRMVTDHQKCNQDLTQLISQKGASVTDTTPGMKDKLVLKHLQGLNGPDFDKAYIKRMVADHKEDIRAFQKETEKGDDADIKNFASKTLPVLQEHLTMAQSIESKINAPTASNQ